MLATIIWFLLTLGILVTFHEFGHFYIARRCGVKVLRFSVGFGKALYTWRDRHGTEFVLAAIPLGGYVKMLDEREGAVKPEELPRAFSQKSVWQRMAIVSAGPMANFILAVVVYCILALAGTTGIAPVTGAVTANGPAAQAGIAANEEIVSVDGKPTPTWSAVIEQLVSRIGDTGNLVLAVKPFNDGVGEVAGENLAGEKSPSVRVITIPLQQWLGSAQQPDLLGELGITRMEPITTWTITQVEPNSAAQRAGLVVGDQLITVDATPLVSIRSWIEYIRRHGGAPVDLVVRRDGLTQPITVVPERREENGISVGKLGIGIDIQWPDTMIRAIHYSPVEAVVYGVTKTWDQAVMILSFLKKLTLLDISVKNIGGAITIAQVADSAAGLGWVYYLGVLAGLSVTLGVFNLLPIPVLDGGHLLFYIIEAIKGRPLPEKIQLAGYQVGLCVIVSIMVLAQYNDLVRLFS